MARFQIGGQGKRAVAHAIEVAERAAAAARLGDTKSQARSG
jgi:hypothetical protein